MGLFDYIIENAFNLPSEYFHRHECTEENALNSDSLRSLPPGTPVYCNFTLNIAEHSGICVGNRIVHLDGSGKIISSTPHEFLARLDGNNIAINIYYAAVGRNEPLYNEDIANRALDAVGKHRHYSVLTDNCHGFTVRCLTGNANISAAWSIRELENAITNTFGTDLWQWRCWGGWRQK